MDMRMTGVALKSCMLEAVTNTQTAAAIIQGFPDSIMGCRCGGIQKECGSVRKTD
jgi:hypothetical protein